MIDFDVVTGPAEKPAKPAPKPPARPRTADAVSQRSAKTTPPPHPPDDDLAEAPEPLAG
jgi:hypothetical protein